MMIGVVVDNVVSNVQNYIMFRELNKLAEVYDCYLFANTVQSLPAKHNFAILQQLEALCHKGILIGTGLINTQIVSKCLTCTEKYYYMWHPEWTQFTSYNASQLNDVLYNDEINIITRSRTHHDLVNKLFHKPHSIVYNWNSEQLIRALKNEKELF